MKTMPTVRDLARMAGVSIGTVSRVLNDAGNIAPEIRKRTLEVIKGSGYQAAPRGRRPINPSDAGISRHKAKSIAKSILVLSPEMNPEWAGHELWVNIMSGVRRACEERSYSFLVSMADSFQSSLDKLHGQDKIACGAIVKMGNNPPVELRNPDPSIPLVGFGSYSPDCPIPQIATDNYATGAAATKAVLAAGHSRIAFINTNSTSIVFANRANGYMSAMKEANCFNPELLFELNCHQDSSKPQSSPPDMREVVEKLKALHPSAVVMVNDWAAFGLYKACHEQNVKIPDFFSVMGIDDSSLCKIVTPELSSMSIPITDEAYFATCTLFDMIEGASQHLRGRASVQYIPVQPVIRDSVKQYQGG